MRGSGLEHNRCAHTCDFKSDDQGTPLCGNDVNEVKSWVERFSSSGGSECKGPGVETSLKDFQSVLYYSQSTALEAGQACVPVGRSGLDNSFSLPETNSFLAGLLGGLNEMTQVNIFSKQKLGSRAENPNRPKLGFSISQSCWSHLLYLLSQL